MRSAVQMLVVLAAVWPAGDETSARRQAVHRAVTAGGRPNAETTYLAYSPSVRP